LKQPNGDLREANTLAFLTLKATFLTWHRYFIHTYEQKLNQCGYNGTFFFFLFLVSRCD